MCTKEEKMSPLNAFRAVSAVFLIQAIPSPEKMRQPEYSNDPITFGDRRAIQDTISRARGLSGLRLALRIYMHCRHVGPFP